MTNNQINNSTGKYEAGKRMSIDQPRQKKDRSFNLRSIQESINKQLSNFTQMGSYNSPSAYSDLQMSILQLQE